MSQEREKRKVTDVSSNFRAGVRVRAGVKVKAGVRVRTGVRVVIHIPIDFLFLVEGTTSKNAGDLEYVTFPVSHQLT